MFDKEIEFSAHEDYFALKEDYPTPIKLNIPEWYKKLEHTINKFFLYNINIINFISRI
jgi:hypothetical protein